MDKISLAGDLGSGKSTVAKILIEALGAEYYTTGGIVRGMAEKMGMGIKEFNLYMETHPEIDKEIDDGLVALADDPRPYIIDSRMAWHFTKGTFSVYLTTELETAAARIWNAKRPCERSSSLEETVACTRARRESEKKRYYEQYGVDITDLMNYSLVVDTTVATPEEVAGVILSAFEKWKKDKSSRFCYLSPERLGYIDDERDSELISSLSERLECCEEIPEVTVFEKNGTFYVESGVESALAYAFNFFTYVPARLIKGDVGERKYVNMKNSL